MNNIFQTIKLIILFLILSIQFSAKAGTTFNYTFKTTSLTGITNDTPDDLGLLIDYTAHTTNLPTGSNELFSFTKGSDQFKCYFNNKGGRLFFSRKATYNGNSVVSLYTLFNTKVRFQNGVNTLNFTVSDSLIWVTTASGTNPIGISNGDGEGVLFINDMVLFDSNNAATTFSTTSSIASYTKSGTAPFKRKLLAEENYLYDEYDYDIINQTSQMGNALQFDGTSDYVSVPSSTSFNFGTADFTLEAWIQTTDSGTSANVIIGRYNGSGNDYWLGIASGKAIFSISGLGITGSTTISDGKWHHIAGVRSAGKISIYVDGNSDKTSISNTNSANPSGNSKIGAFNTGDFYYGKIDEVRIWNIARSQSDIQADMNAELVDTTPTGLVAYYTFDIGTACGTNTSITTIPNLTNISNIGTLTGFAKTGSASNFVPGVTPNSTANVCVGETQVLTNDIAGGTWTSSNTAIATVIDGTVTGVAAGSVNISYSWSNGNSCNSTSVTAFTVNAIPVVVANTGGPGVTIVNGATSVCIGKTAQLRNSTTKGGIWTSSNTNIATVDYTGLVTGITNGSAIITYFEINASDCMSSASTTVTVNALPVPIITASTSTICSGSSVTLSTANVAGNTFKWATNANGTSIGTNNSLTVSPTATTTYYVTVTNASGCIGTSTGKTITVNVAPSAISGPNSVCTGITIQLSNTTTGGTWSSTNTGIATIANNGIVAGVAAGSATINYTISGCSVSKLITVNQTPSGEIEFRRVQGSAMLVLPVEANGTTYHWFRGLESTIYPDNRYFDVIPIDVNMNLTKYGLIVTNANGCSASSGNTLQIIPDGNTNICTTGSVTLTATAISGATYRWSSGQTTQAITVTAPGTYNVVATLNGTTFTAANPITVTGSLLNAGTLNGGISICVPSVTSSSTLPNTTFALYNNSQPVIKWQSSLYSDFSYYVTDITSTQNVLTVYYENLNQQTTYYRAVTSGVCGVYYSNVRSITFNSVPQGNWSYRVGSFVAPGRFPVGYQRDEYTAITQTNVSNYAWFKDGVNVSTGPTYETGYLAVTGPNFRLVGNDPDRIGLKTTYSNGCTSVYGAVPSSALSDPTQHPIIKQTGTIENIPSSATSKLAVLSERNKSDDEKDATSSIIIYPNPTKDKITIQLSEGMENATITIYSSVGVTNATDNNAGLERVFNLQDKPRGVYLVKITEENGVISAKKLVLE